MDLGHVSTGIWDRPYGIREIFTDLVGPGCLVCGHHLPQLVCKKTTRLFALFPPTVFHFLIAYLLSLGFTGLLNEVPDTGEREQAPLDVGSEPMHW